MLFMKHTAKFFSLLLSLVLLINSFYITAFANITYDADTLYLSGATYSSEVNILILTKTVLLIMMIGKLGKISCFAKNQLLRCEVL